MAKSKAVYRIKNTKTGEYVKLGCSNKATWLIFPSEAIRCNIKNELSNQEDFEVEMCEFVVSKRFTLQKKEIKWLTREVLVEKTKENGKR